MQLMNPDSKLRSHIGYDQKFLQFRIEELKASYTIVSLGYLSICNASLSLPAARVS